MFRKSVSFFILVALLWVLLWVYIPDGSPGQLSISDFFRGIFLLFSLMAFGFALLMLFVRYKGLDLITRFVPHAGLTLWLAKHAYQYSQPKLIIYSKNTMPMTNTELLIQTEDKKVSIKLASSVVVTDLGYVREDPVFQWHNAAGELITEQPAIEHQLKAVGKNIHMEVRIGHNELTFSLR